MFQPRESPITILFKTSDCFNAVYGYVSANIVFIILTVLLGYLIDDTSLATDTAYLCRQFNNVSYVIICDLFLHAICYGIVYPTAVYYVNNSTIRVIGSLAAFASLVLVPIVTALKFNLSFVLTFALTIEQTRIIMKSISFLVECHRILQSQVKMAQFDEKSNNNNNQQGESKIEDGPTVGNFTYFLFAPTLIYRPVYPQTGKRTNWSRVTSNLFQMFVLMVLGLQLVTKKAIPTFSTVGIKAMTVNELWYNIIFAALGGTLSFVGLAYGFLHCWLNAWAEMLHFADRAFYREWWLADSFSSFWSRWNTLIHSWISEYLFKPLVNLTNSAKTAMISSFVASALIHEYITGFSLGFWYPLFAITMLLPVPLILMVNKSSSNLTGAVFIQHCAFLFCFTSMYFLYGLEYFARVNCPPATSSVLDLFIPRSISCFKITH